VSTPAAGGAVDEGGDVLGLVGVGVGVGVELGTVPPGEAAVRSGGT
jgi:hypothetical protein